MKCSHCGAPEYGIVAGRCRYCGTTQAAPETPAASAPTAPSEAEPDPPRPAYPLTYSGAGRRAWSITEGESGADRVVATIVAVPLVVLAWCSVFGWSMLADVLGWLHRRHESKAAGWLLELGFRHPWLGFVMGSVLAAAIMALFIAAFWVR